MDVRVRIRLRLTTLMRAVGLFKDECERGHAAAQKEPDSNKRLDLHQKAEADHMSRAEIKEALRKLDAGEDDL